VTSTSQSSRTRPGKRCWHWRRANLNVLCVGNSGTGKSHIAIALGLAAIEVGFTVRFINVMELTQELLLAAEEYHLPRYLKSWDKVQLAIFDEFGCAPRGTCLTAWSERGHPRRTHPVGEARGSLSMEPCGGMGAALTKATLRWHHRTA